jgi:hypothetical protein
MTGLTGTSVILADSASSAADAAWVEAWAAVITASVAVVASVVAGWQIHEARKSRRQARSLANEVAQPYVMTFAESDSARPQYIEFVIKNFGQTAAYDVTIAVDPELRSSTYRDHADYAAYEVLALPARIPVLAPSQEWRTFWDDATERADAFPDRHNVVIYYTDSYGTQLKTTAILDFSVFEGRTWLDRRTIHDMAEANSDASSAYRNTAGTH